MALKYILSEIKSYKELLPENKIKGLSELLSFKENKWEIPMEMPMPLDKEKQLIPSLLQHHSEDPDSISLAEELQILILKQPQLEILSMKDKQKRKWQLCLNQKQSRSKMKLFYKQQWEIFICFCIFKTVPKLARISSSLLKKDTIMD